VISFFYTNNIICNTHCETWQSAL